MKKVKIESILANSEVRKGIEIIIYKFLNALI